ncbi:uncharacterized protein B0T23DRAFT_3436 [Neurospora hispaniola]|uniref:Uncharacterized protein n=1 Tax=Neurospora hispaniola TaxID=588809 RepID=A0AAJ0IEU5_9PEZI|nr:hypothetical protein B0T23DRAFT_3436 [Neurospora hispaniola]
MSWDSWCAHQGCRYPRRKESETCSVLGRAWVEGLGRRVTYIVPAIMPDLPFANQILEGSVSIVDCCVSGRDEPDWSLQGGWFEARDDSLISSSSTTDMIHFFGPANYCVRAEHEDITCLGNGSPSEDALSGLVRGNKDGFGVRANGPCGDRQYTWVPLRVCSWISPCAKTLGACESQRSSLSLDVKKQDPLWGEEGTLRDGVKMASMDHCFGMSGNKKWARTTKPENRLSSRRENSRKNARILA